MSFDTSAERTQNDVSVGVEATPIPQETQTPPFYLPDQVAGDPALAASLIGVVRKLSGANSREAFAAHPERSQAVRDGKVSAQDAARRAEANRIGNINDAWDSFMDLAGYPQFARLEGRGRNPQVSGTRAQRLWSTFNATLIGPSNEKARGRYTRALKKISEAAVADTVEEA